MKNQWIAACGVVALSACTSTGNLTSIYHKPNLADGRSVVLDAQQWAVLNIPRGNDGDPATHNEDVITCAMPSPDAIAAAAASGHLSLDNPGGSSGAAGVSLANATASIGLRTQSIQLLRDAMFRMCEAYAAGGVDDIEYGVMMRRFQSSMIAILAIEQLTGAVAAQQGAVSANVDNSTVRLAMADLAHAQDEQRDAQQKLDDAKEDEHAAAQHALDEANQNVHDAQAALSAAVMGSAYSAGAIAPGGDRLGSGSAQTAAAVAQTVESITLSAMSHDYPTQMCFESLRVSSRAAELAEAARNTPPGTSPDRNVHEQARDEDEARAAAIDANVHSFNDYCITLLRRDLINRLQADAFNHRVIDSIIYSDHDHQLSDGQIAALRALLAQLDQGWSSADLRTFPAIPGEPAEAPREDPPAGQHH